MKSIMPVKAVDIVVRAVNYFIDGDICQNVSEGSEIMKRYRVDYVDFVTRGDLNEAELLWVVVFLRGVVVATRARVNASD